MAEKLLAITAEYVRNYLAFCQMDIRWPSLVRQQLKQLGLDMLDVLHVVKEGQIIMLEERFYGTKMVVEGCSCDEVAVRVELWVDLSAASITVEKIHLI